MFGHASRSRALLPAGFLSAVVGATALTVAPAHAVVGDAAKDGQYSFTAKLDIGEGKRSCSGTLVDEQWVLTAASCFADNGQSVKAGAPQMKSKATIGRADLSTEAGQVRDVVELIPRNDRDLVMARLAAPVPDVVPANLATHTPASGEELRIAGYGRTKDEWVPDRVHSGTFGVDSVKGTTIAVTGKNTSAVCKGDTGGPALRAQNGRQELAAVSSTSWQGGCLGSEDEARKGAVESRVDDINHWIQQVRSLPKRYMTATGDFDGDGKTDLALLTDYGQSKDGRNQTALWVYTAKGDGFAEPRTVWDSGSDSWNWESGKLVAGDFDGDGNTDLGVLYNYGKESDGRNRTGLWTFTSRGDAGFEAPRKVWESGSDSSWSSWNWESSKVVAGDFNGDGKSDLAVLYNYGKTSDGRNESALMTFTSIGDGFNEPRKVWESGKDSWNWNTSKLAAGDFNGDGRADLAVLYGYGKTSDGRNHTALWMFDGSKGGFNAPRMVWDSGNDSWNWDASKLAAGDFNGDGRADLAVLYGYGKTSDGRNHTALWMFDGSKGGFNAPRTVWDSGNDSWNWDASELTAGDFNGDGKTDISVTYDYGRGADGRIETGLWAFTSKGDGVDAPRKVWSNSL
ncbi:FG-GAP-like repeat-containing protein [Streptomyces sp. GS7]|uniref:FG-GAP-like repeat-containing protein n=1 Tax=Streptomyces sp. GS7 TaxID=2692234 RepID=UPI001317D836|nr:FG-GAP-like repeat-containing protein [Streptomyces sp. GS7]QHC21024.1 trypsin-like serine protease [Streptomyces sp. GS7]